jgi:hypothetical protein
MKLDIQIKKRKWGRGDTHTLTSGNNSKYISNSHFSKLSYCVLYIFVIYLTSLILMDFANNCNTFGIML